MAVGLGGGMGSRMSASMDSLHHPQPQHLPVPGGHHFPENNLRAPADKMRRFSMAPGSLESMAPQKSRHFSGGSQNHTYRDFDDRESLHGSTFDDGDDTIMQELSNAEDMDDMDSASYIEEDNSELLSMQVETYVDAE